MEHNFLLKILSIILKYMESTKMDFLWKQSLEALFVASKKHISVTRKTISSDEWISLYER